VAVSGTDRAAATIWWVRRDLRLADNPALAAAVEAGGPVIPVFVKDAAVDALGAAPRWRLGLGVEALARRLAATGARLILREGLGRARVLEREILDVLGPDHQPRRVRLIAGRAAGRGLRYFGHLILVGCGHSLPE